LDLPGKKKAGFGKKKNSVNFADSICEINLSLQNYVQFSSTVKLSSVFFLKKKKIQPFLGLWIQLTRQDLYENSCSYEKTLQYGVTTTKSAQCEDLNHLTSRRDVCLAYLSYVFT
jgi:hypothetical protein